MSFETDFYTRLDGVAAGRIYPMNAGHEKARPYVTWTKIAGGPRMTFGGPNARINLIIQVDVWADTAEVARSTLDEVTAALQVRGADFSCGDIRLNPEDYEAETKLYRASADFSLWYINSEV